MHANHPKIIYQKLLDTGQKNLNILADTGLSDQILPPFERAYLITSFSHMFSVFHPNHPILLYIRPQGV